MKNKKKTVITVICAALAALVLTGAVLLALLPVTYRVDGSLLAKNPDYDAALLEDSEFTTLYKENGGAFRILGFTDLHLDHNKEKGEVTMELMIRNIVREKPDLVVLVGDNITSALNRRRAKQLCSVFEELGVYWTCVLGNHEGDNIWSMSRQSMVKLFASYPHCLLDETAKTTADGTKVWGAGNHVVNLAKADGTLIQSLYFLDGGADMTKADMKKYGLDTSGSSYDCLKESQIVWYKETVGRIEALAGGPVRSLVFDHIALPEMQTAYTELEAIYPTLASFDYMKDLAGSDPAATDALVAEALTHRPLFFDNGGAASPLRGTVLLSGLRRERVCCPDYNSGMFDAILELGSTQAFICGHDHVNDFALRYKGVELIYNQVSGYSSYNVVSSKRGAALIQGGTVYTVGEDGSLSWKSFQNAALYPEMQEEIKKLY